MYCVGKKYSTTTSSVLTGFDTEMRRHWMRAGQDYINEDSANGERLVWFIAYQMQLSVRL